MMKHGKAHAWLAGGCAFGRGVAGVGGAGTDDQGRRQRHDGSDSERDQRSCSVRRVKVPPGTYTGPTVKVEKSNLTIKGSRSAIIDATGNTYGITVGTKADVRTRDPTCPAFTVSNFKISGLTIRNADDTGIFLFGVDGFQVTRRQLSRQRRVRDLPALLARRADRKELRRRRQRRDDLRRRRQRRHGSNATNSRTASSGSSSRAPTTRSCARTKLTGNTAGIFVIVLPGLPKSSTENALIEENNVTATTGRTRSRRCATTENPKTRPAAPWNWTTTCSCCRRAPGS